MMESYIHIGKMLKAHGLDGELKADIQNEYLEDFLKASVIFIEQQGQPVPYFVEEVRGGQLLVKLEGVVSRTQAQALAKKKVSLREDDILTEDEREMEVEQLEYEECKGFMIVDVSEGELGLIQDILDYPQQEMAVIEKGGKEILIPLIDAFVKEVNKEGKKIIIELPEGLLNL